MCSGSHLTQMDSHPSAIGAFLEGVVKCSPQPHIKSSILKVNWYNGVTDKSLGRDGWRDGWRGGI